MLRHAITIERKTQARKATGGLTDSWATLAGAPTRAGVVPVSGREFFSFNRVEARYSIKAVVRHFDGLTEDDRVVFDGDNYNITYIENVEHRDRWLVLYLDGGKAT